MNCDVYESTTSSEYAVVPTGVPLPNAIAQRFAGAKVIKTIAVTSSTRQVGLDAEAALRDIAATGYHIAAPGTWFRES